MSIKVKITILFLLSLILMLTLSLWLKITTEQKNTQILISKYIDSSKEILPLIFSLENKKLNRKLEELKLKEVKPIEAEVVFKKSLGVGEIAILKNSDGLFLKIEYLGESYYFFDMTQEIFRHESLITTLFFIFDIALLIFIYFSILKIVAPIKKLSSGMEKFAKGDFNITMKEEGAKEIVIAAKSFNKMARDLKRSFEDRENLLRYFGHEIRTPLAKAKYALEAKDIEKIRENLNQIERFVKDVLNLHLITSFNLDIKEFRVSTLIAQALNKSNILNEDSIVVEMEEDFLIKGDLEYLSIALKNLIQNGLDYTTSFPIKIEVKKNIVRVISSGDELKEGLEFYIKPFAKGSTKGFGLGLSLTKLILEKHNFDLIYSYNNGKNIFGIVVKK